MELDLAHNSLTSLLLQSDHKGTLYFLSLFQGLNNDILFVNWNELDGLNLFFCIDHIDKVIKSMSFFENLRLGQPAVMWIHTVDELMLTLIS